MSISTLPDSSSPAGTSVDSVAQWQSVAQGVVKPKMDISKALAIMGFSSSRMLDASNGHEPKAVLSQALTKKMQELENRRQAAAGTAQPGTARRFAHGRGAEKDGNSEQKQRDSVRILHEAYQFLSRRYLSSGSSKDEDSESNSISPMAMLDQQLNSSKNIFKDPEEDTCANSHISSN